MSHGIREVVERGMCVGCGACGARTSGAIPVKIGRYGVYQADLGRATNAQIDAASKVCPFSDHAKNEDVLAQERHPALPVDARVGRHDSVFAGRLTRSDDLMNSSSGGMTSFYLAELLRTGRVDAVAHVGRSTGDGLFEYMISSTPDEILDNRKSAYYATTLEDVAERIASDDRRFAVVGVPCFIKAFRLLADQMPEIGSKIEIYAGLVCGHLKSRFFAESLAWQAGVAPDRLEKIDFRVKNPTRGSSDYDYAAFAVDDTHAYSRRTKSTIDGSWGFGAFQPEACNFCDDIFAETADVVFADAWLPQYVDDWSGTNVVLVRDARSREIFEAARDREELTLDELTVDDAAQSQSGNYRHRRDGLRVRLADDIAAGRSVPAKRVTPGYDGVSRRRLPVIRHRRAISALSLRAFERARRENDFDLYGRPMRRAIRTYRLLDVYYRGGVVAAVKAAVGMVLRLR